MGDCEGAGLNFWAAHRWMLSLARLGAGGNCWQRGIGRKIGESSITARRQDGCIYQWVGAFKSERTLQLVDR